MKHILPHMYLSLCLLLTGTGIAVAREFSDVPRTHWAYDAIDRAAKAGLMKGYEGKFHGRQSLNRYQVAAIIANILKKLESGASAPPRTLKDLQALQIEFAKEIALFEVRLASLEEDAKALRTDVDELKHLHEKEKKRGAGFTGYASFAFVGVDELDGGGRVRSRYGTLHLPTFDGMEFFTMPSVSLGIDKEINDGLLFHAQFDYLSEVNTLPARAVFINEAFFDFDRALGRLSLRAGAFALPFSREHNGPFRSCNLTITPSAISSFYEYFRAYGFELRSDSATAWRFAVVSGTDLFARTTTNFAGYFTDFSTPINQGELDSGFGYYLTVDRKAREGASLGWNAGYFNNGGDDNPTAPHRASPEIDYWFVGLDWRENDFRLMAEYLSGSEQFTALSDIDLTMWYVLASYTVTHRGTLTVRYDKWDHEEDNSGIITDYEGNAVTMAYSHVVTNNSMIQFEWLSPDEDNPGDDRDDDLVQIRYKVNF